MRKKLKTCRGTSIAEMMIAVILLALLTAGGITAASAVMASYNRMKEAANADILASTVIETISNEVRLGREISSVDGKSLTLDSAFFGEGAELKEESGRLVAQPAAAAGSPAPDPKQLLSESTYNGLHLDGLEFDVTSGVCTVSFSVLNSSDQVLWNDSAAASPLQ